MHNIAYNDRNLTVTLSKTWLTSLSAIIKGETVSIQSRNFTVSILMLLSFTVLDVIFYTSRPERMRADSSKSVATGSLMIAEVQACWNRLIGTGNQSHMRFQTHQAHKYQTHHLQSAIQWPRNLSVFDLTVEADI